MAYDDMTAAIEAKLDAVLVSYEVQHENQDGFTKPDNAVYCRTTIRPGTAFTVGIGARKTYRLPGVAMVQVFGPVGTDKADIDAAVKTVMEGMAYVDIAVGDPEGTVVKFAAPYPTEVGRVGGEDQVNVTSPFQADYSTS